MTENTDDDTTPETFYDGLAPFYHLIYPDWEASMRRQAAALDALIKRTWGEGQVRTILDVACGIGTQALGLAALGYQVTGSDLSRREIVRAKQEADARTLDIDFAVADMRNAFATHGQQQFDLVIACDNSVPHLLSDADLLTAFREFYACTKPGGGCLITVRDYETEERTGTQIKPIGVRHDGDKKHLVLQVWEFLESPPGSPLLYDLSLYLITDAGGNAADPPEAACSTRVLRSRYYAVGTAALMALLEQAGFQDVARFDDAFYQPVLLGKKPLSDQKEYRAGG